MQKHTWLKPLILISTTALLTLSALQANDFNNDGTSDILWRSGGTNHLWQMQTDGTHTYVNIGTKSSTYTAEQIADFNGDGIVDILWRKGHKNYIWYMNTDGTHSYKKITSKSYDVVGADDFNNDGIADILWRKDNNNHIWYMNADGTHTYQNIGTKSTDYTIAGTGDLNGDGVTDILWRKGHKNYIWYMNTDGTHSYKKITSKSYNVKAVKDFNNDGIADILWRKDNKNHIWYMNANGTYTYQNIGNKASSYTLTQVGDYNGDGVNDILWRKDSSNYLWTMHIDGTHTYKKISGKGVDYVVVGNGVPIRTLEETYNENETVSVNVQMALSGDKDWVGIFRKGSNNSWGNVVKWNWVNGTGIVALNLTDYVANSDMPAGEYEARLFYHNEYGADAFDRATYGFSVTGGGNNNYIYGSEGPYINEVVLDDDRPDYFVYYPKNHIQNAPLVLVSGHRDVHKYKGLMKYLASQGCYVVGHATRQDNQGWGDPIWRIEDFELAITRANDLGVDTSRLITMGSSAGGMVAYPIMKHFIEQGLGATKSFIIDIIGYYATGGMTKSDLNTLESDSLILHIGTDDGTQDGAYDEDPRTLLTLSKLLNNDKKKSFIALPQTNHGYAGGTYANVITKKDLLIPIDAMLKYEFFNSDGQYNDASTILFDTYDETVQRLYDATMQRVGNNGPLDVGYNYPCVNPYTNGGPFEPTIDYCNDHGLQ